MIEYLSKGQVTVDELRNLYQSVGWTSYTQDSTILEKTLEGSRHYIIARSEGRLVGLVRSVGMKTYQEFGTIGYAMYNL